MTYAPVGLKDGAVQEVCSVVPTIFWPRLFDWSPFVMRMDTMASYPTTLDLLAALVVHMKPKTIVEAGTYRGHATFAMAEALYLNQRSDAHVYTADIHDLAVNEVLAHMHLLPYATFYHGPFEAMLKGIETVDMAYIDASATDQPALRTELLDLVWPKLSKGALVIVDDANSDEPVGAALRERAQLFLPQQHGLAIYQR